MTLKDFEGKKIAVLGFGIEGASICGFLPEPKNITVFDEKEKDSFDPLVIGGLEEKGIKFSFAHIKDLGTFDYIFRSPGIHPNHGLLTQAKQNGAIISSATKLFFDLCPCSIIGVTGTKGKGTTSSLIYEMLKAQGIDAYLGGNIGVPPLSFLNKLESDSKVVLELSSFQLQDLDKSPHIAVMLMTTQEHLAPDKNEGTLQNYHKDIYEYVDAKRNIFRHQTQADYAVVNKDYPASNESDIETAGKVYKASREQEVEQGCYVKDNTIYLRMSEHAEKVIDAKDILLPGRHNLENICAAIIAAIFGGAKMPAIVKVLKTFKGLEHRLELVKIARGVKYYDDSFSTTPETAIAAIEAFDAPEILLLGGASKSSDFTELGNIISEAQNIKAIIQIGKEWEKIKEKIPNISSIQVIDNCETMEEAVKKASEISTLGDVVLLSPACSSFDRFKNYKERGNQFKDAVNNLK